MSVFGSSVSVVGCFRAGGPELLLPGPSGPGCPLFNNVQGPEGRHILRVMRRNCSPVGGKMIPHGQKVEFFSDLLSGRLS